MRERAKDPERHAKRMAAKQKIMQERIARAQNEQGVLLVMTGPGKGKSSSGFGMVARALGPVSYTHLTLPTKRIV